MSERKDFKEKSRSPSLFDPEMNSFEQSLRRMQPRQARLDRELIFSKPDLILSERSQIDGKMPASPVPDLSVQTSWRVIGTAWAGGMLMGACLMFLLLGYFQTAPPSGLGSLASQDDRKPVTNPDMLEIKKMPKAVGAQSEEWDDPKRIRASRNEGLSQSSESESTVNRSQANFTYRKFYEDRMPRNADFRLPVNFPLSVASGFRDGFGMPTNWGRLEPLEDGPSDWKSPSAPTVPLQDMGDQAKSRSEYRLQIYPPPSTPAVNIQYLTQKLINETR